MNTPKYGDSLNIPHKKDYLTQFDKQNGVNLSPDSQKKLFFSNLFTACMKLKKIMYENGTRGDGIELKIEDEGTLLVEYNGILKLIRNQPMRTLSPKDGVFDLTLKNNTDTLMISLKSEENHITYSIDHNGKRLSEDVCKLNSDNLVNELCMIIDQEITNINKSKEVLVQKETEAEDKQNRIDNLIKSL